MLCIFEDKQEGLFYDSYLWIIKFVILEFEIRFLKTGNGIDTFGKKMSVSLWFNYVAYRFYSYLYYHV